MMTTISMNESNTFLQRPNDFAITPLSPNACSSSVSDELLDKSFRRLTMDKDDEPEQDMSTLPKSPCPIRQLAANKKSSHYMADPKDVQRMRHETRKLLILCLQAQLTTSSSTSPAPTERMASILEQRLFDMAPTLVDYSNVRTLEMRLRVALREVRKQMRSRRQAQARRSILESPKKVGTEFQEQHGITSTLNSRNQPSTPPASTFPPQATLGAARCHQIQELVDSIRYEQNQLVGLNCAKCKFIRRLNGERTSLEEAASFGSKFPEPVKQLFFQTPLVDVWNQSKNRQSCRVPLERWASLLHQAQRNLQAYHEWKAQNFVCPRS